MDVDAYAAAHDAEWRRLAELLRRRRLSGPEADELVTLYQRTAVHLSTIRSASPDPALVGRLSSLVARARSAVTGAPAPAWRDAARFVVAGFPAALYLSRRWWVATAALSLAVAWLVGAWVAGSPRVQASIATPAEVRQLVEVDFAEYYSASPAGSFAAQVWTNNAYVAALCLVAGVLLVPVVLVLAVNVVNIGVTAGLMAAAGRLDLFFGLITPHGLLELTAVFVAAGAGLKLGWTVVDPGGLPRRTAVAAQARTTVAMALGVAAVLAVSGVIEAFVTPSGLPTWARIGIGALAEALFLAYVWTLGRRAARAGETGDVTTADAGDVLPSSG
ncbi:stage II sporulation protein M [Pseudonocardia humida]|uniref:Stage II sporulation protein M n=1 Tax=Pseudonocardia humida TaxID=2800819 RepID=A0ABT0ZY54_9PSEU|nr:stage II sporulation protein M [Pseudonocardia humida]MCO1655589.1 stage II sporulation protein M [Pseudonocardia humida]